MKDIKFRKVNKSNLTLSDLQKLGKEDLAENFLTCYSALQDLLKENEELKSLNEISKETIQKYKDKERLGNFNQSNYSAKIINNTFTCFFCLNKLDSNKMLAGIFANPNILLCNSCSKDSWAKAENIKIKETDQNKPDKKQLQEELKYYEEMGLENYLASFKEIYLNHVKDLKNKLKEL